MYQLSLAICIQDPTDTPIDEKNEKMKGLIRKKAEEYIDRAEKLKEHLNKPEPARVGANGSASGGKKCVLAAYRGHSNAERSSGKQAGMTTKTRTRRNCGLG
jgi:hypothetical protein